MPSLQKVTLRPFIGGLNTEINGTIDSTDNTSDELNCTIFNDGTRGRRYGLTLERYGEYFQHNQEQIYSGYLWKNVNKTSQDVIVYQVGNELHFYKYNDKPYSTNKFAQVLDITEDIIDQGLFNTCPVSFTIANGRLIMVSKYMFPLLISYDAVTQTFSKKRFTLYYRDFEGLEENLRVDEMPVDLSNTHHYNLINQGWRNQEINAVKSGDGKYPSNSMQWFLGKDQSGSFNVTTLLATYFGNTQAPKGHCILDYFERDRSAASGIYDSAGTASNSYTYWDRYPSGSIYWVYQTRINRFTIEIPNSTGVAGSFKVQFFDASYYDVGEQKPYTGVRCELYGWNGSSWVFINRGTDHISGGRMDATFPLTNETEFKKYKVDIIMDIAYSAISASATVAFRGASNIFPYTGPSTRVTDVTTMSGKIFYLAGDTVLFSQNVNEDANNINKCYQENDPTSEDLSDLLPTDGGSVKFHSMGDGLALTSFNRGILVFGRERVYGLLSPRNSKFTAIEYDYAELSSAGLAGAKSVVSVADAVFYWSPMGIFRIGVNYNTGDTLVAENITQGRIQQYYNNITDYSKTNCKGVFDYATNRIYWYYPTEDGKPWKLDGVLVYDMNYDAFMPYKIAEGGAVVGVFTTVNANRNRPAYNLFAGEDLVVAGTDNVIAKEIEEKYDRFQALQHCIIDETGAISFGDYISRDFRDWLTTSYDSYMISTPLTFNDTWYKKQAPILQTIFLRTEEDYTTIHNKYIGQSGAYLRMRWNWAWDALSNRWDLIQNCYKPQKDFLYTDYIDTLIHIRGRGRSLQIEVRNDQDKDFRLASINMLVRI